MPFGTRTVSVEVEESNGKSCLVRVNCVILRFVFPKVSTR